MISFLCKMSHLSFLSLHARDVFQSPLISSLLPLLILPGNTFAIFLARRAKDSIPYSQHAPIFTKSFYRFFHSPSLPSSSSPLPLTNPFSAIRRIQDVIVRREYVTRGRAEGQTSNQAARRDGSLWADREQKGGKMLPNP